jgi:hypothetical protein
MSQSPMNHKKNSPSPDRNQFSSDLSTRGPSPSLIAWSLMGSLVGIMAFQSGCSRDDQHRTESQTLQAGSEQGPNGEALQGTWAKLSVFTSQSSALGVTAKSSVGRYSLVQLQSQGGGAFTANETLCDVKTKSSGGTSISFSDRLVRSIGSNSYSYQFSPSGMSMGQAVELLGVRLANKLTDPLSSSASYDQDGDGNPGVSVDVSAKILFSTLEGQIYVMQRTIWGEKGQWQGTGRLKGNLQWSVEQKTLGSSNPLLSAVSPTITTLTDESPFYLVKISDGSSCQNVIALQGRDLPNL